MFQRQHLPLQLTSAVAEVEEEVFKKQTRPEGSCNYTLPGVSVLRCCLTVFAQHPPVPAAGKVCLVIGTCGSAAPCRSLRGRIRELFTWVCRWWRINWTSVAAGTRLTT